MNTTVSSRDARESISGPQAQKVTNCAIEVAGVNGHVTNFVV